MNLVNMNFTPQQPQIPYGEDVICLAVNDELSTILEKMVYTDLFNKLISGLYIFILFGVIINLFTYYKFKNSYNYLTIRLKIGFIVLLFIQMATYIYISYIRFLIYYNYWNLALFFFMLFPFFYILIIYNEPIVTEILRNRDLDFKIKK